VRREKTLGIKNIRDRRQFISRIDEKRNHIISPRVYFQDKQKKELKFISNFLLSFETMRMIIKIN
jgi:hypothetical protein